LSITVVVFTSSSKHTINTKQTLIVSITAIVFIILKFTIAPNVFTTPRLIVVKIISSVKKVLFIGLRFDVCIAKFLIILSDSFTKTKLSLILTSLTSGMAISSFCFIIQSRPTSLYFELNYF
jgi:hypothetical protein